jgi:D-alanyl-D-alanine carboxypeptidase
MRRALVILWLISLSACAVLDDKPHVEDPVFDPQLSDALQKALEEAARFQKADSISASLYISDRCFWEGTAGVTKPEPSVPVESDMLFGFASITKTFVAAIVLQLVEENKLELNDPLGKWLEQYPNVDANITIRQLLNHGSGIYNYTDNDSYWSDVNANPDRVWLPEDVLKYVKPPIKRGVFPLYYSNTNYTLLGMIIESATGNLLEYELQNRITRPLHLNHTYLAKDDFDPKRWANSTALRSAEYSSAWADGAVASTSKEIAKWSHRLYSGNFLKAKSMQSMFVTEVRGISQGGRISAGLGVWKLPVGVGQELAWGHGGWLPPFLSRTLYIPKFELSVAYASSSEEVSMQGFPTSYLVSTYVANRPDNISMCFNS